MLGHTPLTDRQRITWALLLAVAVHVSAILAIGFRLYSPPPPQPVFSLNLALLQQAGGDSQDQLEGMPLPAALHAREAGSLAAQQTAAVAVDPAEAENRSYVPGPDNSVAGGKTALQQSKTTAQGLSDQPTEQTDSARQLAINSGKSRPSRRSKTLQAEDKTTLEGFYAEKWRLQVQSLSKHYFPDEARAKGLSGRLTLDVAVRSDGTLLNINLLKSSGISVLDNAARRIVMLAAPFEPFPESLRQRYDILHIVRTWEFDQGNQLRSDF